MLGRKWIPKALPPLAARYWRRWALSVVQTWSASDRPSGMPSLAQLTNMLAASGTSPTRAVGTAHRRLSDPAPAQGEPGRHQQGGDDAGVARRAPVECGEQHQYAGQHHPPTGGALDHAE